MEFLGRDDELKTLRSLKRKSKASFVVVAGRRRIGKSTLVEYFAKDFKYFYEFQGIAPRGGIDNQSQLKNFAVLIKKNFGGVEPILRNWSEAFTCLAKEIKNKPALVFLDEISWMGKYDPDFVGYLKIAWDTEFSKNDKLLLVVCGSVSSWIEENILNKSDFIGRISQTIRLRELDLKSTLQFWGNQSARASLTDRISFANICGGVPKYLEEYDLSQTVDTNVKRLCFKKGGYLVEDFDKIFSEIFGRRSEIYREIVRTIVNAHLTPQDMSKKLGATYGGDLTKYINDLELSGFIARDYLYKPGGVKSRLSKLRISDNYLRFYLKYIESNRDKINRNIYNFSSLSSLIAWPTIQGLQFENLILNRFEEVLRMLDLEHERILSMGSYFQEQTTKTEACQVDLLIECKPSNFYFCEIKMQNKISFSVIKEVQNKISKVKLPRNSVKRPILIYFGELDPQVADADYFDRIVNVGSLYD